MANQIDPALLRQLLRYEPETGKLWWRQRPREFFTNLRACSVWNARYTDKEALTYRSRGYLYGRLFDESIAAHRAIWAIAHGVWPIAVDHINGDRGDNRLVNLREVTRTENNRNARLSKNNHSGVVGVCWDRRTERWAAYIGLNSRRRSLGMFCRKIDAVASRQAAEVELGYHPNHGRAV